MSSGQAAWAEEREAERHQAHCGRLEALGSGKIASIVDDLSDELRRFELDLAALSRSGWSRLDRIKELLARLD